MAKNTNQSKSEPYNKDFKGGELSGPKEARFKDDPQRVWEAYEDYKNKDPQKDKRKAILAAYYGHPYKMTEAQRQQCLLNNPSRTNFGLMRFKVNQIKARYLDLINETPVAWEFDTEWTPEGDTSVRRPERQMWARYISEGFQRYFIDRWDEYHFNVELDIQDMLLFGKAIEYFDTPTGAYSENIPMDRVFPNSQAKMLPCDWDSVAIEREYYYRELWENVKDAKTARDAGWNRDAVIEFMRRANSDWNNDSCQQLMRRWEDGNITKSDQNRKVACVVFYAREYEPQDGNLISKYIIPGNYSSLVDKAKNEQPVPFLFANEFYIEKMSKVLHVITDFVGHGSYYYTPSFAESIYVACRTYDQKMNRVIDATEINSMLMTSGGDANAGKNMAKYRLYDRIHFPPGTTPVQHRFELPVAESMGVLNRVVVDMNRGIGSYEMMMQNAEGGKTPISATQSENDAAQSARIESSALRRFNIQRQKLGEELYTRFWALSDADDGYEDLQMFLKWLRDHKVPLEAAHPKQVRIKPSVTLGGGNVVQKMQTAARVIEALNITPRSLGQENAQKDFVSSMVGVQGLDRYFPEQDKREFPVEEDRTIGMENEMFKEDALKSYNLVVIPHDNHAKHLFGSGAPQLPPRGHLDSLKESATEGLQAMAGVQQVPDTDQPVLFDKIAQVITELYNGLIHVNEHLKHINVDSTKKGLVKQAQVSAAEIQRAHTSLSSQLAKAQEARLKRMQQKIQQEEGIDANTARDLADLEIQRQKTLQDEEAREREFQQKARHQSQEAEAKREAKRADDAQKLVAMEKQSQQKIDNLKAEEKAKPKESSAKKEK